jgi:HSP20 family molecular chaperone IbpA
MWLQALELADEAERLQRQFLRYLGPSAGAANWEPPADIHETPDGLVVLFALPGVASEDIEIQLDGNHLTVSAMRPLRSPRPDAVLRQLEIPHGRFVRRLALPAGARLELTKSHYQDGCLQITFSRVHSR